MRCCLLQKPKHRIVAKPRSFIWEETGATAVEYAVMLALIILVMIGTIGQFGSETHGLWSGSIDRLEAAGFMR
ncbi:MAG: Flp family type IVb pilin [Thermogutta sp.]